MTDDRQRARDAHESRKWNLERWFMVIMFVWGVLGGTAGAVWFVATEWTVVKEQVAEMVEEVPKLRMRVEVVNEHLNSLQRLSTHCGTR